MGRYGYNVGDSVRLGDSIAFILAFGDCTANILWEDGVRAFDIDCFSVCNVKRVSRGKGRKFFSSMRRRQCDGEFAEITSRTRSLKYADIAYHDLYFEKVEILPFLQGIYKLEDDCLTIGTIEERNEALKSLGLSDDDLLKEEYENFKSWYGTSIEVQERLELARQKYLQEKEKCTSPAELDALLDSYDKRNHLATKVEAPIDEDYDEYALDDVEIVEEDDDLDLEVEIIEEEVTVEDKSTIVEESTVEGESLAEEVEIVADDEALSEEVEIVEEKGTIIPTRESTGGKKSVTLKGLGDGIIVNEEKPKESEKTADKEPLGIRSFISGTPSSVKDDESAPFNKNMLKVGYSFRNKLGVLMTIIKVENESVTFALGNKGGKTCTLAMKNLRSVDTIDHVFGSRVGTKKAQVSGIIAEIVEDEDDRLTVRYENGSYQTHVSYELFSEGKLFCPVERENYLRKQFKQKNGLIAMIVAYRNQDDISVLLSNGVFVESVKYSTVEKGGLVLEGAKGDTQRNALGMLAVISKYKDRNNITVSFEDGSIVDNVTLNMFVEGDVMPDYVYKVGDQYRIGVISDISKARLSKGKYVFEGTCLLCQKKVEGTKEELQTHKC